MRLLAVALAIGLAMVMLSPVGAVQIYFDDKNDDDYPPFYDDVYGDGYTQDANFELSETVIILDARQDPASKDQDNANLIYGTPFCLLTSGLIIGAIIFGSITTLGIGLLVVGIVGMAYFWGQAVLGGGQKVQIEAYDASTGKLVPAPNVLPIIKGGARGWLGSWGFSDARTGDDVMFITNNEGKTAVKDTSGLTFFGNPYFNVTIEGKEKDMRFTSAEPNGGVKQFVMKEASSTAVHNWEKMDELLSTTEGTVSSLSYMTNSELEDTYDMSHQTPPSNPAILEAPSNLLEASTMVEFRVIIIVYRKSQDYKHMTDEAIEAKGLSDIEYLPRIRETCDYYLNTNVQGEFLPFNEVKGSDNQISSTQDQAYGFVDYMLDSGGGQVHPTAITSASNSMAYILVWGRYEGAHDDGLMTTEWNRYNIQITDNDNGVVYYAQPVAVCLDNSNIQTIHGYPASVQAYVVMMLNYTPVAKGSAYGRSLEINAQLKEINIATYHTFWRDNVSIHPIKLVLDMAGQAGLQDDNQPFSRLLTDWIDYETWDEHTSPHRRYVTLRTNDEWIPMSFCVAYIEQSVSRVTVNFYLCPNGATPIDGKTDSMQWNVHDITINITLSGENVMLLENNFGDDQISEGTRYVQSFSTNNLQIPALPILVNISLNATFYWDSHMIVTAPSAPLHRVNITAFGSFPIQENYDNFMTSFETNIKLLENSLTNYPIAQSSLTNIRSMINSYCDARAYISTQIDSVKSRAESKNSIYARVEVENAEIMFSGITDAEKNTGYVGTCEREYRNNIDQLSDMTDPFAVGGYTTISYKLMYLHYYIFERLNMAMFYVDAQGNYTKYEYARYAVMLKEKGIEDPVDDDDKYNKKIDWSLVVAVIAIILAIISTILLYKMSKEKDIIPSDWMSGWKFAVVIVGFCGIACLLYLIYWTVGLMVANNLGAYCSIRGWF
jgi:hypothetical protein